MVKEIPTTGHQNVSLSFSYFIKDSIGPTDNIKLEWWNGSTWSTIKTYTNLPDGTWSWQNGSLNPNWISDTVNFTGANNQASFKFRFVGDLHGSGGDKDEFWLDCLTLSGMSIPPENTLSHCSDGIDNDLDGLIDLLDSDCAAYKPKLTVTKIVSGGIKSVSDFALLADAISITSGSQKTLDVAKTYTITETNDPNYSKSFSGDCNSNGQVTLRVGDTKSCTLTNTWHCNSNSDCNDDTVCNGLETCNVTHQCVSGSPLQCQYGCDVVNGCNLPPTDTDQDGIPDSSDNCPTLVNLDQLNSDTDLLGDACDNCPNVSNNDQADTDGDEVGNVCDLCPNVYDPAQLDTDGDSVGNSCDNCPNISNTDQTDDNGNGTGNACEVLNAVCGNGVKEETEQCDDGNLVDDDGCSSICQLEQVEQTCGNGIKEETEECDDGNSVDTDVCSNDCKSVVHYDCSPTGAGCVETPSGSFTTSTCDNQCSTYTCNPSTNLLNNGSFENPVVSTDANWDIFSSGTSLLEWLVDWVNGSTDETRPITANLELHRGVNSWTPSEGNQYAELDSDWDGPAGSLTNEPASVSINQNANTTVGARYNLSFDFSPRPDTDQSENILRVFVDDTQKDEIIADGVGSPNTGWTSHSYDFTAVNSATNIKFGDYGTPDSLGTFIDNVKLTCIVPVCGNQITELGEQCDDGNTTDDDGCSSTCNTEPVCGNGTIEGSEECDGSALGSATCSSLDEGFDGGTLSCKSDCSFDTVLCTTDILLQCTQDSDCNDNNICNGTQTCSSGQCISNYDELQCEYGCDVSQGCNPAPTCENVVVVSDTNDDVFDVQDNLLGKAVLTWNHTGWTAIINSANWIWKTYNVENPIQDETYIFKKNFDIVGALTSATLKIATDNSYKVWINDILVGEDATEFNYNLAGQDEYNITNLHTGSNSIKFEVKNWASQGSTSESNPAGLLYKLDIVRSSCEPITGIVSGHKYNDLDKDGDWDERSESGLSGWNICVDGNKDGDCNDAGDNPQTTTSSSETDLGFYTLPGIPVGETQICEVTTGHEGWTSPTPCKTITVVDGQTVTVNFFNYESTSTSSTTTTTTTSAGTTGGGSSPTYTGENPTTTTTTTTPAAVAGASTENTGPTGEVLGASTGTCDLYLYKYIKLGGNNDPEEVIKLQHFLNEYLGLNLPVDGIYGQDDYDAVVTFQLNYKDEVLQPWVNVGLLASSNDPTGYVYRTTQRKINLIVCPELGLAMPDLTNEIGGKGDLGAEGSVLGASTEATTTTTTTTVPTATTKPEEIVLGAADETGKKNVNWFLIFLGLIVIGGGLYAVVLKKKK